MRKEEKRTYKNEIKYWQNWKYNREEDYLTCPNNRYVEFKRYSTKTDHYGQKRDYKIYECEKCERKFESWKRQLKILFRVSFVTSFIFMIGIILGVMMSLFLLNEASGNVGNEFSEILVGFLSIGIYGVAILAIPFILIAFLGIFMDRRAIKHIKMETGMDYVFYYSLIKLVLLLISLIGKENRDPYFSIIMIVFLFYTTYLAYRYRGYLKEKL